MLDVDCPYPEKDNPKKTTIPERLQQILEFMPPPYHLIDLRCWFRKLLNTIMPRKEGQRQIHFLLILIAIIEKVYKKQTELNHARN